jgi:hypothetical protein
MVGTEQLMGPAAVAGRKHCTRGSWRAVSSRTRTRKLTRRRRRNTRELDNVTPGASLYSC